MAGKLTLKIGHVGPDISIQRIDNHLSVRRARNLNASIDESRGRRSALPGGIVADVLCLGEEIGQDAAVELGLANLAALEQRLASGVEGAVEESEECESLRGEDLFVLRLDSAEDGDALEDSVGHGGQ